MSEFSESLYAAYPLLGRNAILLDTNLMVVYTVACLDIYRIGRAKRTEAFTSTDGRRLLYLVSRFRRRRSTPAILAESFNLLEPFFKTLPPSESHRLQTAIREEIDLIEEHYVPAKRIAADDALLRYGFTDLAIASHADNETVIVTVDLPLIGLLEKRNLAVLNYNHLRTEILR
ncbi:MAG TPA: hypothetical protein VM008_14660 [Phycisphaerae bacterium]|nr:hypothetical protein [Phycisphaerae bacterium]